MGGGGGGISSSRFRPSLTGLVVPGEECGATAEITRSFQIDLVLTDAESRFSHFAYGDAAMRPKCVRPPKMQYLREILQ